MDPHDPQYHHQPTPLAVSPLHSVPPPLPTTQRVSAPPQHGPHVSYGRPTLPQPPFTAAPPPQHAYTRSTQFGWSHPIYNGNSWEAPARAPHYPEHTPVAQSWQPFYSAPPPTAPTLGPQRSPLAQPYPPGFQPLYQGARADAWYEPSVEEYAQRLEDTWGEGTQPEESQQPASSFGPHAGSQPAQWSPVPSGAQDAWGEGAQPEVSQQSASSLGPRAGSQPAQWSPVPSGVLEAIVDGPVTYDGAGATTVTAATPAPSPPASRASSLSALLPPEPAPRGIPVRYSHMGTLATDVGGRTQTARNRHARRSSGPDTLTRHPPPYSGSPRSSSGSDSDRDTPRSRRRRTRTRAARRDRPQHSPDTDFSLAALRRSIMEEVRREIRAEMQGQVSPGAEEGLTSSVTPHEGTPDASRVIATRGVTWHADTRDNSRTASSSRRHQRQLSHRRRSSLESVWVDGGGNPEGSSGGSPAEEGSDSSPPIRRIADPEDDNDTQEVRALLITLDGGSLWMPCSGSPHGLTISTLPRGDRPRSSTPDVGHLYRVMRQIGAPLSAYERHGGRHGYPPIRLTNPMTETWTIVVDRAAIDLAIAESRFPGEPPLHRWEYIPPTAPESATLGFDSDALLAWTEASTSDWFRNLRQQRARASRPIEFPAPVPPPPPPLSARPAFPRSPPLSSAAEPFEPSRSPSAGTRGSPTASWQTPPTPPSSSTAFPSEPPPRPPALPPGMLPVQAESLIKATPQEIREEHKTKEMVMKCVRATPKFPAKTATGAAPSDNEILLQLEQFARATKKLFDETIVREAMLTPSCTPAVSDYLASVPSLLWDLKESVLGDKQKRHLERAAGGSGFQDGWQTRYTDLDTFFCDLALCSLKQHYLERVFDETKAMRQSDKESASDFFARLDARRDAVNFLAGRVAQCVHMSDQMMLTTFRAGLRYAGKVMRRLHQERLDISKPGEWEQRAREQDFPGTHVALLKLREIADNVETDMESKAADKLAAERASRPSPFSPSANSGRTPFFRSRAVSRPRAPLAVMGDSSVATAAAATSTTPTTPTPASSVAAPGVRRCFACGSPDHIVRNCPDEVKLQAWRANAPSRLARQPQHVAAVVWSAEQAHSEDLASVPECFVEEVCALMECEEVEPFVDLCHLCGLDVDLGEEHAPAPGSPAGEQE